MSSTSAAKCVFFYKQGEHGWSEAYYTLKTIADAYDACIPLGNALIRLRGKDTAITALRISQVLCPTNQLPNPRSAQLFPPLATWASGGAVVAPGVTGGAQSDTWSASILARCVPQTPQPGTKSIYMGGMPDIYDQAGGQAYPSFSYWFGVQPIRALQQALWQNAFGWMGITTNPGQVATPITGLTNTVSGFVTVTVATSGITAALAAQMSGQVVPLRISGVRQPGNLNGTWPFRFLYGTTACTFTSTRPFAVLTWDGTGTVTYSPKNFIPFCQANIGAGNPTPTETLGNIYAEKVARRKRGLPFGLQHGRRKAVKRY